MKRVDLSIAISIVLLTQNLNRNQMMIKSLKAAMVQLMALSTTVSKEKTKIEEVVKTGEALEVMML